MGWFCVPNKEAVFLGFSHCLERPKPATRVFEKVFLFLFATFFCVCLHLGAAFFSTRIHLDAPNMPAPVCPYIGFNIQPLLEPKYVGTEGTSL
jgi:hypothetical protein